MSILNKNAMKKVTTTALATLTIVASTVPAFANQQQENFIIAHDGIPVIVSTEHITDPMLDHLLGQQRSRVVGIQPRGLVSITGSSIERQQVGNQFRAHGHLTGSAYFGDLGASAQMWSGGSRINRGESWISAGWNGGTVWSTSPFTNIAGTARIFAHTHPDF